MEELRVKEGRGGKSCRKICFFVFFTRFFLNRFEREGEIEPLERDRLLSKNT